MLDNKMNYTLAVKNMLQKIYIDRLPLAYVHSFGCAQNVSDGEKIKGCVLELGYALCDDENDADLIIYNTCAIRNNAENRVFGNIGRLLHLKKEKKNLIVGLCGCMLEQNSVRDKIKKSYPQVDIVWGTNSMHRVGELIYGYLVDKKRIFSQIDGKNEIVEDLPVKRDDNIKALVSIMYGCNNFCTYCIVPYVRGRERSRKSEDIFNEVQELVKKGYKDITLLGQNVNSYGKGLEEDINFSGLLNKLNKIDGDFRIRFMTSHPKDATFELIDTIANCEKVSHHIHLPIQSGSDRVLKLMNRNYTLDNYMNIIEYARKKIKDVTFSSDIIIGFPGEIYEDYQKTVALVEKMGYTSVYMFIYSKRDGTRAAEFEKTATDVEISDWFSSLLKIQNDISYEYNKSQVGKTKRILVDSIGKSCDGYLSGKCDANRIVEFKCDDNIIGEFVNVKITKAMQWGIIGEIVD